MLQNISSPFSSIKVQKGIELSNLPILSHLPWSHTRYSLGHPGMPCDSLLSETFGIKSPFSPQRNSMRGWESKNAKGEIISNKDNCPIISLNPNKTYTLHIRTKRPFQPCITLGVTMLSIREISLDRQIDKFNKNTKK